MTAFLSDYWKLSGTGIKTLDMLGERGRFGSTVDSVLYDSADSYSQSRLFYLQSRRHELGLEQAEEDYFDPYEDLYGE
jgi:phospholipid-binding lipoprotein MlaA